MTTHYHAGYNMVGYLPEMEPFTAEDWSTAKGFMLDEMARVLDYAPSDPTDRQEERLEELSSEAEDLNLDNGPEWGAIVGNMAYWIMPCDDEACELEEEYA